MIQNPEADPEMSKQDLIKYISKKKASSSSGVVKNEKNSQETNSKEKEEEKVSMLWDANPEVIENYWSSSQRD